MGNYNVVSEIKDGWSGREPPMLRRYILYTSYPDLEHINTSIKNDVYEYFGMCEYEFTKITEENMYKLNIEKFEYYFIILDKIILDKNYNILDTSEISDKIFIIVKKFKNKHPHIKIALIIHEKVIDKFTDLYHTFRIANIKISEEDIKTIRNNWTKQIEYLKDDDKKLSDTLNSKKDISQIKDICYFLNDNAVKREILFKNINKSDDEIINYEKEKEIKLKHIERYNDQYVKTHGLLHDVDIAFNNTISYFKDVFDK